MAARRRSRSARQARRIALAAQGFADPRPTGRVDRRHLRRVLDRIGLIQIDSVNVLVRSQELPLFARLGPHPRTLIADATKPTASCSSTGCTRRRTSTWRTTNSIAGRWRSDHRWGKFCRRPRDAARATSRRSTTRIADDGPLVAGDLSRAGRQEGHVVGLGRRQGRARARCSGQGRVSVAPRPDDFARIYDLTERVIPPRSSPAPTVPERDARKELLELAARHHGDRHVRRSHRLPPPGERAVQTAGRRARRGGHAAPGRGRGLDEPAYCTTTRACRGGSHAVALLSPFDPLVWNRDRAERLFGFHYRIEIYTPPPKRIYGYYVLPFLLGRRASSGAST